MKKLTSILILTLLTFGCSDFKNSGESEEELNALRTQLDSLKILTAEMSGDAKGRIITSLTFQDNNAENAMNFYVELFDNSRIIDVKRWGKEGPVEEGKIMQATFNLNGSLFMCSDSPPVHDWDFTPAVSNYIECENESELERLFSKLSENGDVAMPLGNYGFSQKFGWVIDRFGVSWQLNLQ